MTKVSKLAFSDKNEAQEHMEKYDGRLSVYDEAVSEVKKEVRPAFDKPRPVRLT